MGQIDIQRNYQIEDLPTNVQFKSWVDAALADDKKDYEVVIRIVDELESAQLNYRYRQKKGPTNILSFDFINPTGMKLKLLGDLVICAPVISREANLQNKPINDHWAHIIIHGVLHLQGYDHITDEDAEIMEAQEVKILHQFNIQNPYLQKSI